jgi:hypothetical protein
MLTETFLEPTEIESKTEYMFDEFGRLLSVTHFFPSGECTVDTYEDEDTISFDALTVDDIDFDYLLSLEDETAWEAEAARDEPAEASNRTEWATERDE